MGDHQQYGLPDLRQLVAGRRTHFQETPQPTTEPFFLHQATRNILAIPPQHHQQTHHHHHHYDSSIMVGTHEAAAAILPSTPTHAFVKLGHDHHHYCNNNATTTSCSLPVTSSNIASAAAAATIASTSSGAATLYGMEMETGWGGNEGGNNNSRWPRQETLTLLEIRSRLDSRFKEANQKGPLWDEVSRIMAEEHGYRRSGKKCREKFENLYKYYRKTKEGKAGRQDGKHYRFFRQLEALYGETSNQGSASAELTTSTRLVSSNTTSLLFHHKPISSTSNQENPEANNFQENNKHSCESISFSNTSEFETSSSENNEDDLSAIAYMMNRPKKAAKDSHCNNNARAKKSWKTKVKDFVDSQMRKVMETQEAWMEKMLKTIEDREQARICREEEWTKQEMARFDREHEFWAKERAWIQARDASLMEALNKYAGKGQEALSSTVEQIALETQCHYRNQQSNAKKIQNDEFMSNIWTEPEILSLLQIRNTMEPRFQESGYAKEGRLWEEIAEKMVSLGYDHRSVDDCKEKWESLRRRNYLQQLESHGDQEIAKHGPNSMNSTTSNFFLGSSFQGPIKNGGGEHLWNKFGFSSS